MNGARAVAAAAVTSELMSHPATLPFQEPRTEGQSLSDVKSRLEAGLYQSVAEWCADIEAIWKSTEDSTNSAPLMIKAAQYSRQLFAKLKARMGVLGMDDWCQAVICLRARMAKLSGAPPNVVRKFAVGMPEFVTLASREGIEPISDREIKNFMRAATMIPDEKMRQDLDCRGSEVWIDITKLRFGTFLALKTYMTEELQAAGMEYPQ